MRRSSGLAVVLIATTVMCSAPRAVAPTPTPLSTARATQFVIPVGFVRFDSTPGGYTICYPATFEVRPDRRFTGDAIGDSFLDPKPAGIPRVAMLVSESALDQTSQTYAIAAVENLNAKGVGVSRLPQLAVDGQIATVVSYPRLTSGSKQRYAVRQAFWADSGFGRVFTLAYEPTDETAATQLFEKMLACYRSNR